MANEQLNEQPNEDILEILNQLRAEKVRRGLSNEDICAMVEQTGTTVHPKTIQRIFKYGGKDTGFRRHTLQTIAVAMGLDLVNQKTNLILVQERQQLERELEGYKTTVSNMSKTLEAMGEQITSMRSVLKATETHTAEREAQIKQLSDQMTVQVRRLKRKDMFLHLFTVSTLTVSVATAILFAFDIVIINKR